MDADRAIAIIETLLAPKSLTAIQSQIVRGVIAGDSYQQIVVAAAAIKIDDPTMLTAGRYQLGYIKETGAQLWQVLSLCLGQKVTKKSLAAVLCWYAQQSLASNATLPVPNSAARAVDWGEGIQEPGTKIANEQRFYGRTAELALLKQWCLNDRCRTIVMLGMGGIGKSTLAWKLAHQIEGNFELTIWRSLLNTPSASELCADLLRFLSPIPICELPDTLEGQVALLIERLNRNRCLLIFDNVESILAGQVQAGKYLPDYEDYDLLFKSIGELPHQSCLLLTSREQPHTITRAQIANPQLVRSLNVGGLTSEAGHQSIQSYGCPALPEWMWQEVHQHYGGNPLALKIATITAVEMTGGGEKLLDLYPLMQQGKLPFRGIDDILERQFDRLSAVEQQIVYWLAIEREPTTSVQLRANLLPNPQIDSEVLNALQSLLRRCIIIRQEQSWTIQPVTIAYVTQRGIDRIVAELSPIAATERQPQQFLQLNTYAIICATAKDYLRQAQIQSSLRPILDRLLAIWPSSTALAQHLQQVLSWWQSLTPPPLGYLAGNILNLLIELAPDRSLKDLDCSGLPIWSAYLVDVRLARVNFAGAAFDRSVFTQAFGGIVSSAYAPTGDVVATGDGNGDIYLWRIADGQRLAIYRGHTNWTRSVAFSPDGLLLASSSEDCTVKIWDVGTGRELLTIGPHTHSFRGLSFSSDGQRLIIAADDTCIRIYELSALLAAAPNSAVDRHCRVLHGHTNWVFSTAYSTDERYLASASADGTVRIWDLATGECDRILPHDFWTVRTIFRPDSYELIVTGMSATIYIWDVRTGTLVRTLAGHTDWIWSIECSTDGKTLYSTGEDRTIRIWDLTDGRCLTILLAHNQRIWTISLSPDGRQLLSGSEDRSIAVWDLHHTKCLKKLNGYTNRIQSIASVAKRGWLVSGHQDRMIRIWNLQNFVCIHTLDLHTDAIVAVAVSPDGNYLASSSLDRTIRIWSLQDLTCLHTIDTQIEGSWSLAFSPDARQLIAGGYNATLNIWNVATATLDRTISGHPARIQSVAVCNVHNLIATACETAIRIWDLHTGACLQTIATAHDLPVTCVTFSPDGRDLASSSMDKTTKVWDTDTWQCVQTLGGHQSWVLAIAFSPTPITHDDRTDYQLISGGCDREILRWDLATGACLQTYRGHSNWIWSIAYTQTGDNNGLPSQPLIASASEDETMKIWGLDGDLPIQTLRLSRPYEQTNIAGATGLLPGERQSLAALGAIGE